MKHLFYFILFCNIATSEIVTAKYVGFIAETTSKYGAIIIANANAPVIVGVNTTVNLDAVIVGATITGKQQFNQKYNLILFFLFNFHISNDY